MHVKFRCGCPALEMDVDRLKPKCIVCGETRIVRVLGDTTPRFVGHGRGPLVQSKALEAIPVVLAPQGALKLKERKDDDGSRTVRGQFRPHRG